MYDESTAIYIYVSDITRDMGSDTNARLLILWPSYARRTCVCDMFSEMFSHLTHVSSR
jgi:hypothetical protein